jgi:hypothetical protein
VRESTALNGTSLPDVKNSFVRFSVSIMVRLSSGIN